jgi:hypothetical protein
MPDIPNVPGVPSLSSYSASGVVLLAVDTALLVKRVLQPQWGIYLNGAPVIASSLASLLGLSSIAGAVNSVSSLFGANAFSLFSIVDFEYKQDWSVSDYPVEGGGFLSYDKVQLPFDVRMRVAAGGSESNRQALLNAVDTAANSLSLYDVYTPEKIYSSCNITHYDYKRTSSNGVGLIIVDIWLTEIRVSATATFTNTQQPGNAGQVGLGNVQTSNLTSSQQSSLSGASIT